MKKDIKEKWVAALRSGEYEQGHGALNTNDRFCCLGVLCDLAVDDGVTMAVETVWTEEEGAEVRYDGHMDWPPNAVLAWADLDTDDPSVPDPETGTLARVSRLNDGGLSFNEIADLIEEHL